MSVWSLPLIPFDVLYISLENFYSGTILVTVRKNLIYDAINYKNAILLITHIFYVNDKKNHLYFVC